MAVPEVSSKYRPTGIIQVDCFPEITFDSVRDGERDLAEEPLTPEEVATDIWEQTQAWMENGYMPIVEVFMPDGSKHTVNLDQVRKEEFDGSV